jgi:PAS domain S-box-containing protein
MVPLVFLHLSHRAYAERARDEQRIQGLHAASGGLAGELVPDPIARQLAASAREVVGGARAEVVLLELQRSFEVCIADDGQIVAHERELSGSEAACAADGGGGAGQVTFVVALSGSSGPIGRLCVWHGTRSGSGSTGFTRRDRALLETLAQHAATALDNTLLWARTSRQRRTIEQVFEHTSEGMLVLARSGRVHGWNPAMQRMCGFQLGDVNESPISLLSPQLGRICESTGPGTMDAVLSTADGCRREVRASYAPIPGIKGEDADEWVVVVRDVTSERETERMQTDFVATVSHELRTPLTAIKGFVETMRRDDVMLDDGQVGMFLEIMGEQADRLERLINDLLDISAIESGRPLKVRMDTVDLGEIAASATRAFQSARPDADVRLHAPEFPLLVEGDRDRLSQVISNLLDNAHKHAASDRPTELRVRWVDERAEVSVRDHGPGIAAADLLHVFDRFYVSADSVTRQGGGAGLGLYICRRLLEAMDGSVDALSSVGDGSEFVVRLPALHSMPGEAPAAPRPSLLGAPLSIATARLSPEG